MSVHEAPITFARPHRARGCLGAIGCVILGLVIAALVVAALSWRHIDRARQWHPYGPKGPVITVWHTYTWGHLVGVGYNRYEVVAGEDPSGSHGADVPTPRHFSPGNDLTKMHVTADSKGITITYPDGDHAYVPQENLKGR